MNKKMVLGVLGGVVTLALIILLALSIANEGEVDASIGYGSPTVTGDALPRFDSTAPQDFGVGLQAPTALGADWDDNEVRIDADGRPKIVMFLAHWCSHCQAEVPVVQSWVDSGSLPADVDLYGITTSTDRLRPNWPPQDWLIDAGWTAPTLMDDQIGTLAASYGMAGTPFYLVLDGDNNVVFRISGEIGVAGLNSLVAQAEASA